MSDKIGSTPQPYFDWPFVFLYHFLADLSLVFLGSAIVVRPEFTSLHKKDVNVLKYVTFVTTCQCIVVVDVLSMQHVL